MEIVDRIDLLASECEDGGIGSGSTAFPTWGRVQGDDVFSRFGCFMSDQLPIKAGPVPDRMSLWPLDDGRYGLDAIFHGVTGFDRMEAHERELKSHRVHHTIRQELDGGWTIRLGPLRAVEVARALGAFVY